MDLEEIGGSRFGEPRTYLYPSDIILIESDGWVGRLIRTVQNLRGKNHTSYVNHVVMATEYDWLDDCAIVDAQPPKVKHNSLGAYAGKLLAIYRSSEMTTTEREAVAERAMKYVGKPYGGLKILLHLTGLQGFSFIDWAPICSWTVARPYEEVMGWRFGSKAKTATPDTIWQYVRAHPEKWTCIRKLSILE
jgi:hypothetical protein